MFRREARCSAAFDIVNGVSSWSKSDSVSFVAWSDLTPASAAGDPSEREHSELAKRPSAARIIGKPRRELDEGACQYLSPCPNCLGVVQVHFALELLPQARETVRVFG